MSDRAEAAVRAAFREQAEWCARLGSPFNALLCTLLAERLDRTTTIGCRVLDWPGDPSATADVLPLRLAGGLHGLARRDRRSALGVCYPPNPCPAPDTLWQAVGETLERSGDVLAPWLDSAPQTNEVARAAILMAGHLVIARRFGFPVDLHEMGASAGLTLLLDRYSYRLGACEAGAPGSALHLCPAWEGPSPPAAEVRVIRRRGVDLNPMDVTRAADRDRLLAYVWPDQAERLARLQAALDIAAADPPPVDREDAAGWVERELSGGGEAGTVRVLQNSIAFQYFSAESRDRIIRHMEAVGAAATAERPLAWLQFESHERQSGPALTLRLWPGDARPQTLATAGAHGQWVRWLAAG